MVRFHRISKFYGEIKALNEVSFELPDQSVVGLIGPNGAGKSTCMKILAGAVAPSEGEFFVREQKIVSYSDDAWKRQIGFLPERAPVYEDLSVWQNLCFWAEVYGVDRQRLRQQNWLESLGLAQVLEKPGSSLSKGYRQRLGIAKALLGEPHLLILDEPLSGLDPSQRLAMRDLIRELGKSHSILFSSHQLLELEQICDYFVFLKEGQLVAAGSHADIVAQQSLPWLEVSCFEPISVLPDFGFPVSSIDSHSFRIQCPENLESTQEILRFLHQQALHLRAMQWKKADLEQVFRTLNS